MKNRLPYKTFNLFDSYNANIPFLERLYKWITSIGRYVVIGTEMIVLTAFVARFILDQNLNDLTEKVNDNNKTIVRYKGEEDKYRKIMDKITASQNLDIKFKNTLIDEIPKIYNLAPNGVTISSVDYSNVLVQNLNNESIIITLNSKTDIAPDYEKALNQNILNPTNVLPNPNITLKLLNVSNSQQQNSQLYSFTFKISRIV